MFTVLFIGVVAIVVIKHPIMSPPIVASGLFCCTAKNSWTMSNDRRDKKLDL